MERLIIICNKNKKWIFLLVILLICLAIFFSYKKGAQITKERHHMVAAQLETLNNHLYYTGTIQPIKIYHVVSPVDGIIKKNYFRYGGEVEKNQLLTKINAFKAKKDYATLLSAYVKDKDQYLKNKRDLEATIALYKQGIVDQESYLNEESQFQMSKLTFTNSYNNLKDFLENTSDQDRINIDNLELKNIDDVQAALEKMPDEFSIYAPIKGTILMAQKSDESSLSGGALLKSLEEGGEVKKYQVLMNIGDMTGIATTINVGEKDINQIMVGQPAALTSVALSGMAFHGKVSEISKQAINGDESAETASFPVRIVVPQITLDQSRLLRIGMTVMVDLPLQKSTHIRIPLKAVIEKDDQQWVKIIDATTGKTRIISIKTGNTDVSDITVLEGLKPNDKVVVPD